MFGKFLKNNKEEIAPSSEKEDIFEKISREMVTHNMPAQEKIAGSLSNPQVPGKVSFEPLTGEKKNFKAVGVFIMIGGLVLVSVIIFLTYKFVIAPTASLDNKPAQLENEKKIIEEPIETGETSASGTPAEIVDSPSDIVPVPENLSPQTASTSISTEMPEESEGKNAADLPPLLDSDGDGLFDDEEIIFGTSVSNTDSDGDGYKDVAELLSGYDPAVKGGKLTSSASLLSYSNSTYGFSFSYPKAWPITEPRSDLAILSAADDSLVQISVSRNEDGLGILTWFEESFPSETVSYDNLISKSGFEAIKSQDGLNFYITDEKRQNIIVISYIPASVERLAYKNVYEVISQSFSF